MTHQSQSNMADNVFPPGSLWNRLQTTSRLALKRGALEPIDTKTTHCEDRGVQFLIRVVSNLRRKPPRDESHNPFLPYEKPLHVANASATHACILNKYNVVDLHLLVITRKFEHQESLLTLLDFQALWRCMREYDSLGFYNSGTRSGASQKHKHLQLVPLPLTTASKSQASKSQRVTLLSLLDRATCPAGKIAQIDGLPFRHAFVRWDGAPSKDLDQLAASSMSHYREMMCQMEGALPSSPDALIATPYNLLVSQRWMMLVPRVRECYGEVSLNSLAFAGALLVRNTTQLEWLHKAGPFAALQAVAPPAA